MSAHEYSAWWRFAFSSLFAAYLFWWLFSADHAIDEGWSLIRNGSDIFLLFFVALSAYALRRKGRIVDEREQAISEKAIQIALIVMMLVVCMTPKIIIRDAMGGKDSITLDVELFDFYAIACLVLVIWTEAVVTVWYHLCDRRRLA
jgi:uncharacterized membrane protein